MKPLPFFSRWFLGWICLIRIWFDGAFAAKVAALADARESPTPKLLAGSPDETRSASKPAKRDLTPALQLLALLQQEGRFVDFIQQDVDGFSDEDVGAAARVLHSGCRRVLSEHFTIGRVREEDEGAEVTVRASREIVLTGNVSGSSEHRGVLEHSGWRAERVSLPEPTGDHDPEILAPAQVEIA